MREIRGKRALITGAARGIGRTLALRLADEGAEILLVDLDEEALAEAAGAVRGRGATAHGYRADVTDADAVRALRERVHAEAGPLDVLVNNAGVVFGGPFLDVALERHRKTYEVNTLGLVTVTHVFLPDLISRPEAHLVNLSSASGFIGLPYGSTYASSKWSVTGFSESIRLELALLGHRHVGVTTVCPSYVDTGLFEGARPPLTTGMVTPERLAELVVRAIKKRRSQVLVPWLVKVTPLLRGILPRPLFDTISRAMGATTSMQQWRGRDEGRSPSRNGPVG